MHSKNTSTWVASSLFTTVTSITSFDDVRLSIVARTSGATAFISATTFASCSRSQIHGLTSIANAGSMTFVAFSMPWQQNVFRKTFLVVHVLFEWRFPGVRSVISATYLRLPTQISLLLSTGLAVRIFGLGFSLLLPLPLLPLLVRAIDVRQWSDGKTSQKVDRRDVNCNLVVLKMAWSQSGFNFV